MCHVESLQTRHVRYGVKIGEAANGLLAPHSATQRWNFLRDAEWHCGATDYKKFGDAACDFAWARAEQTAAAVRLFAAVALSSYRYFLRGKDWRRSFGSRGA